MGSGEPYGGRRKVRFSHRRPYFGLKARPKSLAKGHKMGSAREYGHCRGRGLSTVKGGAIYGSASG